MRKDIEEIMNNLRLVVSMTNPRLDDSYMQGVNDLAISLIKDLEKIVSKKK